MPTVGSLFAGAGGFDLGFEAAGFTVAWQVEVDRDCVSVLARHWPDTPRWGDIREVDPTGLAPVDVVIFGSPCQDFSVAGKRAGLGGGRSGLFDEAIRVIRGLRPAPAFCVWENVPGALSSARGRDFGAVLDALADIGALDIAWRCLDARHFGVPQRRRRIFLVADFGAERAGQVLFEPEGGDGDLAACGEAGEGLAGDVEDGAGVVSWKRRGGYGYSEAAGLSLALESEGGSHQGLPMNTPLVSIVANSVQASAGHHGHSSPRGDGSDNLIAFHLTQDPINGAESRALGAGNEHGCSSVAVAYRQNLAGDVYESDVMARVRAGATGGMNQPTVAVAITENLRAEVRETPYANAVATGGGKAGQGYQAVREGMAVRRLTPRETERLQGWPDDFTRWRANGDEISDGPRYRMVGNGVAAPVAAWIGRRLLRALEQQP